MQVIIELNTDKEILWALPGGMSPLTLSSPRASIETDKLTEQQKASLVTAIHLQKVRTSTKPEEFFTPKPKVIHSEESPSTLSPREQLVQELTKEREATLSKIKEVLSRSVGEVKKEIMQAKDIKFLNIMRTLEQEGKARSTIFKAIDQAVLDISNAVSKSIQLDVAGSPIKLPDPARVEYLGTTIDYDVLEFVEDKTSVQVMVPSKNSTGD